LWGYFDDLVVGWLRQPGSSPKHFVEQFRRRVEEA